MSSGLDLVRFQSGSDVSVADRVGIANVFRFALSFKILFFAVDPPDSPDDYKEVRSVSYTVISIDDAYRFTFNVTWDPPIYPYKQVETYDLVWQRRDAGFLDFPVARTSHVRYFSLYSFTLPLSIELIFSCSSCFNFGHLSRSIMAKAPHSLPTLGVR